MQDKIQKAVFQHITNFFEDYGIALNFRYDEDLDVLEEFRRSHELRLNNSGTYENLIQKITTDDDGTTIHNMGLYNRTPIRRSEEMANNLNIEMYSQTISDKTKVEVRNVFYGELDFSVKILCDNYEVSDIIELLYIANFAKRNKTITVNFDLGDDVESLDEVEYNVSFNEISFVGKVNESSLRYLDLDMSISGLFFLPYYTDEYKLKAIDLHLMMAPNDIPVETQEPEFDIYDKAIPSSTDELTEEERKWKKGPGHPFDTHN